ncbi:hypothetical protein ACFL27_14210, partial [candidate division CSSED10-310 bacterium]
PYKCGSDFCFINKVVDFGTHLFLKYSQICAILKNSKSLIYIGYTTFWLVSTSPLFHRGTAAYSILYPIYPIDYRVFIPHIDAFKPLV